MPRDRNIKGRKDPLLENLADGLLRAAAAPELAGKIGVYWSARLVSTAGMACHTRRCILLHPALAEVGAEEVDRTLRHELAHFLAVHRAGKKRIAAHGPEWRKACADLGIPGEPRCHNLPLRDLLGKKSPPRPAPVGLPRPASPTAFSEPVQRHPLRWIQMLLFPRTAVPEKARARRSGNGSTR